MSSGKFLSGLIAGVAVGAALGILFAPDKGANTRRKISKKGENYLDDFKSKLEDLLAEATNELELAKNAAENFVKKGKDKLVDVKNDLKNSAGAIL